MAEMMKNWIIADRGQLLLLQPSIDEWLPEEHLARYVVEVVERLDLSPILAKYEGRARGSNPYHPALLTALLFYGYATGVMSSRKIELATRESVPFRFIAGGHHPDHTTLSEFRRRHLKELSDLFVDLLVVAGEMGFLKVGTVAIDGTKVKANASKHAAVSYKRARDLEKQLRAEVETLMEAAEGADNTPLREGVDIPAEIARREDRIARLEEVQQAIRERRAEEAVEEHREAQEQHIEKTEKAVARALSKKKSRVTRLPDPPEKPSLEPKGKAQYNFTDPDSRIMPDKGAFSQAYNGQLSVDTATMLIVGQHVTQRTNDKRELLPALDSINRDTYTPGAVLADAGYYSAENIAKAPEDLDLLVSPNKTHHNLTLEERLGPAPEGPAPANATPAAAMRHKLRTEAGHQLYRLRKMTVEPVIGIIKQAMGVRQFLLRGAGKVRGEWGLVCLGYNLRRLWSLKTAPQA